MLDHGIKQATGHKHGVLLENIPRDRGRPSYSSLASNRAIRES